MLFSLWKNTQKTSEIQINRNLCLLLLGKFMQMNYHFILCFIYIYELFRVFDKLQIVSSHVYVHVISLLSIYVNRHIPGLRRPFYLLHTCFDDN